MLALHRRKRLPSCSCPTACLEASPIRRCQRCESEAMCIHWAQPSKQQASGAPARLVEKRLSQRRSPHRRAGQSAGPRTWANVAARAILRFHPPWQQTLEKKRSLRRATKEANSSRPDISMVWSTGVRCHPSCERLGWVPVTSW